MAQTESLAETVQTIRSIVFSLIKLLVHRVNFLNSGERKHNDKEYFIKLLSLFISIFILSFIKQIFS